MINLPFQKVPRQPDRAPFYRPLRVAVAAAFGAILFVWGVLFSDERSLYES